MDLRPCVGCFGCWVKTPGECRTADGSHEVCRAFVASDLVIFASPLVMGFTSALLKNAQDKLIPVLHPHPTLYRGEMHHVSRYDSYPLWGLVLAEEQDTDEEDVRIVSDIYERDSINFKTSLCFTHMAGDPVEDMAREIDGL
jgi:multimeric flavodoxin WrbA